MALTEEEKAKIIEEEKLRAEFRNKMKKKEDEKITSGDYVDLILVIGVAVMMYFMFSWIK